MHAQRDVAPVQRSLPLDRAQPAVDGGQREAVSGNGSLTVGGGEPEAENMADRAMKGRMPSATAARWRRLTKAERSARSRHLREELKTRGWDEDVVRELVHGIDPDHPTLF
ncbi:hypothetical protein [Kocuria sp. SM24M-10]|uniref:hypothetical protein n=1 Tax=Kocuria sp. SM24M-10 TaxID=1660349 RepID=UPI00128CF46E|nr:hypothetical protein [Kocuria sp. SM24M-10]